MYHMELTSHQWSILGAWGPGKAWWQSCRPAPSVFGSDEVLRILVLDLDFGSTWILDHHLCISGPIFCFSYSSYMAGDAYSRAFQAHTSGRGGYGGALVCRCLIWLGPKSRLQPTIDIHRPRFVSRTCRSRSGASCERGAMKLAGTCSKQLLGNWDEMGMRTLGHLCTQLESLRSKVRISSFYRQLAIHLVSIISSGWGRLVFSSCPSHAHHWLTMVSWLFIEVCPYPADRERLWEAKAGPPPRVGLCLVT